MKQFLSHIVRISALAGAIALLAIALITVADIIGRQFGHPVPGAYDLVRLLGAAAIAAALPLSKAAKAHIAIEYFFQKLRRPGRVLLDTLCRLLLLALFLYLAWEFARQGEIFRQSGETTVTLHLPVFWVLWVASAASFLTSLVTLWHLFHPGRTLFRPRP
jgi:TRAP-type C4-dicarboxylate transport system permease small subunit